jgi:hypothetical protein
MYWLLARYCKSSMLTGVGEGCGLGGLGLSSPCESITAIAVPARTNMTVFCIIIIMNQNIPFFDNLVRQFSIDHLDHHPGLQQAAQKLGVRMMSSRSNVPPMCSY